MKVRVETVAGAPKACNATHLTSGVIREKFKTFQLDVTPERAPTAPHARRAFFASAPKSSGSSDVHIKALGGWAGSCSQSVYVALKGGKANNCKMYMAGKS